MDSGPVNTTPEGTAQEVRGEESLRYESAWRRLFQAQEPLQALQVLEEGDPLGLVEQTALRLRQLAILHDVDQVHARVLARVAHEGARLQDAPRLQHLEGRLNRWIDRSVEELLAEDREELRQGNPAYESWDPRFVFLTRVLGVPAASTRRHCVAFNGLGREVRRSFFAITIEGLSIEVSAEREGYAPEVLRQRVLAGFGALLGEQPVVPVESGASSVAEGNGSAATFIDPTVSLALGGILGGSRAELLRTMDPRALAGVPGLVDVRGIRHPAASVVERHLARAARHEVSWLLRQAVLTHLFEDPTTRRWLHRSISTRRRHRPRPVEEIRARAFQTRSRAGLFAPFRAEIELVERASTEPHRPELVAELSTASRDLFPNDQPLVCMAFERCARGDHDGAEELLDQVLASDPADLQRSIVQENLGLVHARRADLPQAIEHYRAAAQTSELRPGPVISWLHTAVQAGDVEQLLEAGATLDDLVAPEHVAVIERCQPEVGAHGEPLGAEARDTLEAVRYHLGPTSLTVTDVYFGDQPGALTAAATVSPVEAELLE